MKKAKPYPLILVITFIALVFFSFISLGEVQKGLYVTISPPVFNGKNLTVAGYSTADTIGAAIYDQNNQEKLFKSTSVKSGKFSLSLKNTDLKNFTTSAFYKVYIFDLNNTIASGVYEYVYFDNIAPDISVSSTTYEVYDKNNTVITKSYFDPVAGEKFIAEYNLSENSYVTVQVAAYDNVKGKGTVVATLLNGVPQKAGANFVTWSGLTSSGKFVNNGSYVFVFTLKDLAGNTKNNYVSPLIAIVKKSSNTNGVTFKGYDLVMPGASDNYHAVAPKKFLKATFNFFEPPGAVSLLVYEKGVNSEVYTLYPAFKLGSNTLNFSVYGNPVFNSVSYGVYYFRLLGSDVTGNPFDIYSNYFVLDNRSLSLGTVSVNSAVYNRTANGYNFASISFTLSRPAMVTVQILDSYNRVVKNLISNNFMDGPVQIAWDLKNAISFVAPGIYKVKITAKDLGGTQIVDSSKTIDVKNVNPF
ncbi:hypothetical protein [Carboxydothermus hydrogenoformans]|uniref:FlgD Ig-like domain-containing protein n=1 Tax=Carboxydothermus hydrogenoformans (strain ATCC BAA-161 / DSM 6008 / Z-2901) TaxID=246194 RepID=Q3ADJ5_CARHZ|nr:hypothetical protein [Carboxydothermus hydrogenoformans]ABB15937.1 hypothetical protein CHY_0942 [Carboxydothermus hydrogenoformans Z-2901]